MRQFPCLLKCHNVAKTQKFDVWKKSKKNIYPEFSVVIDDFELPQTNSSNMLKETEASRKLKKNIYPLRHISVDNQSTEKGPRINELNIQMLSTGLHRQIFKSSQSDLPDTETVRNAQEELKKHGLWQENVELLPDVDFTLPALEGQNIEEHFKIIGEQQSGPYKDLLLKFIKFGLPPPPDQWLRNKGWTMYKPGVEPQEIDCPMEEALVFDVEVCMSAGEAPTLATAVSDVAWYGWVSPEISNNSDPVIKHQYFTKDFIPMLSKKLDPLQPRVIVGHNVSYDRARIKEQYLLEDSGLRFVDTMSLHICVGGVTSYQRSILKSKIPGEDDDWREYSSLNSLKEVYKLYCRQELVKEKRNIFVEGDIKDVQNNFQSLMKYCSEDVSATYNVLQKLLPLFFERFPHPVTFSGMLEMSTAYLPINRNWNRYIQDSQQTFEDFENEAKHLLVRKCDNCCQLSHNNEYKNDLWMWDEKWDTQKLKILKKKNKSQLVRNTEVLDDCEDNLHQKFEYLFDLEENLPVRPPHLPGYPLWFRKLCEKSDLEEWVPGPQLVSTSMKVAPKVLNLTWENYPLYYLRDHGWGFLVADLNAEDPESLIPYQKLKNITLHNMRNNKNSFGHFENIDQEIEKSISKTDHYKKKDLKPAVWYNQVLENCCYFIKLPHKDGSLKNVGNPLAKDFLKTFNSSVLSSNDAAAERIINISRMLSYWRNNCERISGQLAVWLSSKELPKHLKHHEADSFGAILPQFVVCGTLTRRAMERTWMTASNAMSERIGSELRSMVQAPPGYNFVGADVDSQELWIASMIGDAHFAKLHGSTPFGWMTLSGHKAKGTDMHSVTAKAAGITRDHAKVLNYARIYGAGHRFTQRLLKQFNPNYSEQEAKNKASKMFLLTKGQKKYKLKEEAKSLLQIEEELHSNFSALKIAKQLGRPVSELFERPRWVGGTESAMFNRLEEIAVSEKPVTPFLSGRLTRALEPRYKDDDTYLTTKINWVVQSGAVDFLHLMLVCMRWLTKGQVRFCLSFHDEVRYLVPSQNKYPTVLALHITNLLTRAFCAHRLGLNDLPQSVAFFTSVEVDRVLRKEANHECITPSNPHGLSKGYGIPAGESIHIHDAIKLASGSLVAFEVKNKKRSKQTSKS